MLSTSFAFFICFAAIMHCRRSNSFLFSHLRRNRFYTILANIFVVVFICQPFRFSAKNASRDRFSKDQCVIHQFHTKPVTCFDIQLFSEVRRYDNTPQFIQLSRYVFFHNFLFSSSFCALLLAALFASLFFARKMIRFTTQ